MVCLRLAVAPEPFCSAMLRRLLYTPRTVRGAGCISIVWSSSHHMSAGLLMQFQWLAKTWLAFPQACPAA